MQLPNNNSAPAEHTLHSNSSSSPATTQQQMMHNTNLLRNLGRQIEFYFSEANLIKDIYLRQFLEQNNGMIPIDMIANFPMMRKICATFLWGPNLSCPVEALPPVDPAVVVQSVLLYSSNVYLLHGQWLVHPFFYQNIQQQQQQQQGRQPGMYHQRRTTTENNNNNNRDKPNNKSHPKHNSIEVNNNVTQHLEHNAEASRQGIEDTRPQSHTIKHPETAGDSHYGKNDAMTSSPTVTPTSFASNENSTSTSTSTSRNSHPVITPEQQQQQRQESSSPSTAERGNNVIQMENVPSRMVRPQILTWLRRDPDAQWKQKFHYPAYIKPVKIEQCDTNKSLWWLTFESHDQAKEALYRLGRKSFINKTRPLVKICGEEAHNVSHFDKEETALEENTAKMHSTSYLEDVANDKTTEQPKQEMMPGDESSFMGTKTTTATSNNHDPVVFGEGPFPAQNHLRGTATPYTPHQQGMTTEPTVSAYPAPWYYPYMPAYSPTGTSHQQTGFVALPIGYPAMPYEQDQQQSVLYGQPQQDQGFPRVQHMRRHSAPPTSPPRNLRHFNPAPMAYEPVPASSGDHAVSFPIQPAFPGYHTDDFWHGTNSRQENAAFAKNGQPKSPPRRESPKWRRVQQYQEEYNHHRQYEAYAGAIDMASLYISPPVEQTAASTNQDAVPDDNRKNKKRNKFKKKKQKENGPTSSGSDTTGNGGKRMCKKGLRYALNSEFPPLAPTDKNSNNKPKKPNSPVASKKYANVLLDTAKEEEQTESV